MLGRRYLEDPLYNIFEILDERFYEDGKVQLKSVFGEKVRRPVATCGNLWHGSRAPRTNGWTKIPLLLWTNFNDFHRSSLISIDLGVFLERVLRTVWRAVARESWP